MYVILCRLDILKNRIGSDDCIIDFHFCSIHTFLPDNDRCNPMEGLHWIMEQPWKS